MLARFRTQLNGAVIVLLAVALMAVGFGHSISRTELNPDRAFAIAIGGADGFCNPEEVPGASNGGCAACVLTKSLCLAPAHVGASRDMSAVRAADMLLPRGVDLRSAPAHAAGGIRAPPRA